LQDNEQLKMLILDDEVLAVTLLLCLLLCQISCYLFIVLTLVFVLCMSGKEINLNALSLRHAIPSRGYVVSSLASLGDKVFGARQNGQHIDVYDATTFAFQHNLPVPGLGQSCFGLAACSSYNCLYASDELHSCRRKSAVKRRSVAKGLRGLSVNKEHNVVGLAACSSNNCLYASDHNNSRIHRVDLSDSSAAKQWSVASGPAGLSVNKEHNVVVACYEAHKLQEYTTHGTLVREISLQQVGVSSPWHAVQLSTGDYVVSRNTSPGAVSVVGVDGQVVRSYDQLHASNVGLMSGPRSLAVTKNDDILVADHGNSRILSLDSSLSSAQVLALPVDSGLQQPSGLCLDETRGRLYVSEYDGSCRVLVFENDVNSGQSTLVNRDQSATVFRYRMPHYDFYGPRYDSSEHYDFNDWGPDY